MTEFHPISVEQSRQLDQLAEKEFGLPTLLLMENAGRQVAEIGLDLFRQPFSKPAYLVLVGGGNNGGDGLVCARYLHQAGAETIVFLLADPEKLHGDAALNYRIINKLDVFQKPFAQFDDVAHSLKNRPLVVVDALLGTGFHGELRPPVVQAVRKVNALRRQEPVPVQVVAVDIPSGLNGDDGPTGSDAIKADVTVTFTRPKPGLLKKEAQSYVGRLDVVDIGIPNEVFRSKIGK